MNMFLIGVLVGAATFALLYIVMIISKIHVGMLYLHQSLDTVTKAVNMSLLKLSKIEKVTDNTMTAAEHFVDALRESAEQMMRPPNMRKMDNNQFDELRKAFDDGIRQFEEEEEEEDEGEEGPQEDWKK